MLEHLGLNDEAARVMRAIEWTTENGPRTPDLGGVATTKAVGDAIVEALTQGLGMIQAALNGDRRCDEHPGIPCSAEELARDAAACVAAGAVELHLHPRDANGVETLDPLTIFSTVRQVKAVANVPVGVSTGAWIEPDLERRLALIRSWYGPDYASVNCSEDGAIEVMYALISAGHRDRGRHRHPRRGRRFRPLPIGLFQCRRPHFGRTDRRGSARRGCGQNALRRDSPPPRPPWIHEPPLAAHRWATHLVRSARCCAPGMGYPHRIRGRLDRTATQSRDQQR